MLPLRLVFQASTKTLWFGRVWWFNAFGQQSYGHRQWILVESIMPTRWLSNLDAFAAPCRILLDDVVY